MLALIGKVVLGVLVLGVLLHLNFVLSWLRWRRKHSRYPSPPLRLWHPLDMALGHLVLFFRESPYVHEWFGRAILQYGTEERVVALSLPFGRTAFLIGNPDVITEVLTSNLPKNSNLNEAFHPLLGDSILTVMDMDRWRDQRRALSHAFAPASLRLQLPLMRAHLGLLLRILDSAATKRQSIDMDVAGFGQEFHALETYTGTGSKHLVPRLFDHVMPEMLQCLRFAPRLRFPVLASTRQALRDCKELREFVRQLVKSYQERPPSQRNHAKSLLEIMLQSQEDERLTTEEIIDNVCVFLFAGQDTSAHTTSFAFGELARNPAVAQRLRTELDEKLPAGEAAREEHFKALPYLSMVIKETLRMHAPASGSVRQAPTDMTIAGLPFPAGSRLMCTGFNVQMDPRVWPQPDVFDPCRFETTPKPATFFPFSAGPRDCIGKTFAMHEITLVLATVMRYFDFDLDPSRHPPEKPLRGAVVLTVCPENGMHLIPRRRDGITDEQLSAAIASCGATAAQ